MDVTSLISSVSEFDDSSEKKPLNGLLNVKLGSPSCGKQDALEAVKLDPAVLEAQVTVHSKDSAASGNTGQNVSVTETTKEIEAPSPCPNGFEDMVLQQEAALLSLAPHQLELLMKYADTLRRQRVMNQRQLECAFCKNNGKPMFWYTSHVLRDCRGRVQCPVLRGFRCRRCGATGDRAHTIKYCPDSLTDTQSSCSENLLL